MLFCCFSCEFQFLPGLFCFLLVVFPAPSRQSPCSSLAALPPPFGSSPAFPWQLLCPPLAAFPTFFQVILPSSPSLAPAPLAGFSATPVAAPGHQTDGTSDRLSAHHLGHRHSRRSKASGKSSGYTPLPQPAACQIPRHPQRTSPNAPTGPPVNRNLLAALLSYTSNREADTSIRRSSRHIVPTLRGA